MHCMWAALVLLLLYMLTIFLGSRVLDIVLWCTTEQGRQLVDPFVLSVRQLKQLLETRGVSHTGYIEKSELAQLVKDSADVSIGEISELNNREEEKISSASESFEFTGSAHFYEQVEDTKDSVWLVQVIPAGKDSQQVPLLDDYTWKFIDNQVRPFAVRTGIFNCNYGRRLCRSKGWFEPLLLLALPRGTKPKDKVVLRTSQFTRPQAIIEWLREELSIRVHKIPDVEELENVWLPDGDQKRSNELSNDVKVLLFTHLLHPPLFLAALSIKFTGRIKFGMFTMKKNDSDNLKKKISRTPSYMIITPEGVKIYGQRSGEHFNFKSMNTFLRTVQPEINDIFLYSLLFVNMLVVLQLYQISVDIWWKKIASALWITVIHNLFLFWVWIVIVGIKRWPVFCAVIDEVLIFVRYFWMSDMGTMVRLDWQMVSCYPVSFVVLFLLFGYYSRSYMPVSPPPEQTQQGVSGQRAWWEVLPLDCLFRPISASSSTAFVSSASSHTLPYVPVGSLGPLDVQLEDSLEMIIERLSFPNLWLQSHSVNNDYIKDLPVWKVQLPADETEEEVLLRMMDDNGSNGNKQSTLAACGEDCAVCLESYQVGDMLCGLPCGHSYHHPCLMSWLQTDNHHCPICRWPAFKSHPNQHKYHNL